MNPTGESDSDAVRLGFDRRASVFQRNRKSPNIHTSSGVIRGMSAPLPVASKDVPTLTLTRSKRQ